MIATLKESISRYYDDLRAGKVEFKKPEADKEKGGKDNKWEFLKFILKFSYKGKNDKYYKKLFTYNFLIFG